MQEVSAVRVFSKLAMSSGGTKGIGMIGTLAVLYAAGLLANIDTFIGTSVGAVISLLLVVGYTPEEIFVIALSSKILLPWSEMYKLDRAFLIEFGFAPHEKVTANIRIKILEKCGRIPTLKELYDTTGKRLICVTANLSDARANYLDYTNKPDLPCIEAMTASMLIPGLISKFVVDGKLCVDGAFVDPYPAHYLDDGESNVIGLAVVGTELKPESGYFSYLYAAMSLAFDRLQELSMQHTSERILTIQLRLPDVSVLDTGKDVNKRFRCYNIGVLEGMKTVARLAGKTYEEYYGISALPDEYISVPTHNVKQSSSERGASNAPIPRMGDRFAQAFSRIQLRRTPTA